MKAYMVDIESRKFVKEVEVATGNEYDLPLDYIPFPPPADIETPFFNFKRRKWVGSYAETEVDPTEEELEEIQAYFRELDEMRYSTLP
jgi:hypothetical protein